METHLVDGSGGAIGAAGGPADEKAHFIRTCMEYKRDATSEACVPLQFRHWSLVPEERRSAIHLPRRRRSHASLGWEVSYERNGTEEATVSERTSVGTYAHVQALSGYPGRGLRDTMESTATAWHDAPSRGVMTLDEGH